MSKRFWRAVGGAVCVLVFGLLLAFDRGSGSPVETPKPAPPVAAEPNDLVPHFVIEPYLQYPTRESIVIMWETSFLGSSAVEYGTASSKMETVSMKDAVSIHEVPLTGLKPNTKYFYRVSTVGADGNPLKSKLLTFTTAVDADSAFAFTVIGDTQKNPTITGKIAKLMWDRRPNFVVHVGDVVDNGPDKREWVYELFKPSAELFSRVAVFPTIGNHERNHANYYRYFSLPAPEYYYRYRYGNADFFVLDSNKSLKPGSEQFQWLDRELAKSDAAWKFAYHHHPAYSSDEDDYGNTLVGSSTMGDMNVRNLVQLYEKYSVDIVMNGHIHLYERTWPLRAGKVDRQKGIVYLTSGGGGGKLEGVGPTPTWFKAQVRVDFHFCLFNIQGNYLEFKAFDQEGRLFDNFEITKK
jgi:predicted phosphodiesterase